MAELQVPSDVDRLTVGPDTIWMNSDGWVPLKLPDGVNGCVFFKDYGDGTAGLVGNVGFLVTGDVNSIYSAGPTILVPPVGYKFKDHSWRNDSSNVPTILMYSSLYSNTVSGSQAIQRGSGWVSFSGGNISVTRVYHNSNMEGNIWSLVSFNENNINYMNTSKNSFGGPAIVGIEKV